VEKEQVAQIQKLRRERDNLKVNETLDALRRAFQDSENVIPYILDCVRAYATEGEIIQVGREVFGEYREKPVF